MPDGRSPAPPEIVPAPFFTVSNLRSSRPCPGWRRAPSALHRWSTPWWLHDGSFRYGIL